MRLIKIIPIWTLFLFLGIDALAQVPERLPPPPPPPPPVTDGIFKVIAERPYFPGCENSIGDIEKEKCSKEKLKEYILKNIEYPKLAIANNVEGEVVVEYVIGIHGTMTKEKVIREPGAGLGNAVLEVFKKSRKEFKFWKYEKEPRQVVRIRSILFVDLKLPKEESPVLIDDESDFFVKLTEEEKEELAKRERYTKSADGVFTWVEEMPRFPSEECEEMINSKENSEHDNKVLREHCAFTAFKTYINKNLDFPKDGGKSIVITYFVVANDGTIRDIGSQEKVGGGKNIGAEAVERVIQKMNEDGIRWIPGKHNGKVEEVRYSLPIFINQ